MAILQASYISASSHPADTDRLVLEGLMNPPGTPTSGARYGVGSKSDELEVTQNGTPNMSVNVAAGHGWVDGTENGNQGTYHIYNDASVNLVISAADATNPRKDLVVLKVQDAQYSGGTNSASLAVVTGTAAASPSEPTVPANAIVLAMVDVAASASSITNANITDRRRRASALGGVGVCTSSTRPTTGVYEGQTIYETDTNRLYVHNGASWDQLGLLFNPPACRAYHNTTQSIADNSDVALVFNSERYDTDSMHSTSSNTGRITINKAGLYLFTSHVALATGNDYTWLNIYFRLNGATPIIAIQRQPGTSASLEQILSLSTVYKMAANDYVEVVVRFDNTANAARNVNNTEAYSAEFSATWLGTGG